MDEEIKECVNVEALKGNPKLSFFNWLGLCWAFYWRLFLVTCVCMILFLLFVLFLQYVFFWLSYFSPGSTVLPICFTVSKVISLIIALYLAVLVMLRWVLALYNKVFALRIIDSHDNHLIPLKEIKKTEWFKISWSFFWRHILITLLVVIITVIINFIFIYLFKYIQSNSSLSFLYSTKAFFRFILNIVIIFIGLLIIGININWFLRARYKRFKISVLRNHIYTGRNSRRWLIGLLILTLSYTSFVTFSPWKKFVIHGIKYQFAAQTTAKQKPSVIQSDISKEEFISKLFKILTKKRELAKKWKKLSIKNGNYNKNIKIKKEMLKIVSELEVLNVQLEKLKVPKELESIKKLKKEYCIASEKYLILIREFSESSDLEKSIYNIKRKMGHIPKDPSEILKEMLKIIFKNNK